jgi:hypothetical protein
MVAAAGTGYCYDTSTMYIADTLVNYAISSTPSMARGHGRRAKAPVGKRARIAARCVSHGVDALLSRDRDFSLFPELDVHNPLA